MSQYVKTKSIASKRFLFFFVFIRLCSPLFGGLPPAVPSTVSSRLSHDAVPSSEILLCSENGPVSGSRTDFSSSSSSPWDEGSRCTIRSPPVSSGKDLLVFKWVYYYELQHERVNKCYTTTIKKLEFSTGGDERVVRRLLRRTTNTRSR